jgi:hypothetical protein
MKDILRTCSNCVHFLPIMVTYDTGFRRYFCTATREILRDDVTNIHFLVMKQCSEVWAENGNMCPFFEEGDYKEILYK